MRLLALAVLSCVAPSAAFAHAILMQSAPADHASLQAGPQQLVLRYNSRIDHARSRLTLDGSNAQIVLPLEPDSAPNALAAKVELTPGDYTVHWQVLAVDGHLTRGDVRFTVIGR